MFQKDPTKEQLALLTGTERRALWLARLMAGPLKGLASFYLTWFGSSVVWWGAGRRFNVVGLEKIEHLGPDARIVAVANHRSFFDFFVIAHNLFVKTRLSHRVFFPVRSTFFYEGPFGIALNMGMAAMCMFPPILRDKKRKAFNQWSVQRCLYELSIPGTLLGVHPEGKRGKGPDPYELLPAQPGVGRMIQESEGVQVVPIFILGMSNDAPREFYWNWFDPEPHPVDIYIGEPIDFSHLEGKPSEPAVWQQIAEECMDAVAALAAQQRADRHGVVELPERRQAAAR